MIISDITIITCLKNPAKTPIAAVILHVELALHPRSRSTSHNNKYIRMCVYTYIYIYIHVYVCTYVCIYIYIYA